jgi:hypothetical protein
MEKWASVIGLGLTAIGVAIGFTLPTILTYRDAKAPKWQAKIRAWIAFSLVIIGTAFQVYAAWPAR